MIIVILAVLGLCAGSFVNALVWRVHEQGAISGLGRGKGKGRVQDGKGQARKKADTGFQKRLSVLRGRSMCPHCHHELAARDLIPLFSWLSLGGKCRYCRQPISMQYPLVELAGAIAFIGSYIWWPEPLMGAQAGAQVLLYGLWLTLLTGLLALLVYDLHWLLLPNRIMYPLGALAGLYALVSIAISDKPLIGLLNTILAVAVGGGIFYGLFQLSKGKWIGGGDVKLGWVLGLIVGTPARAFLLIFVASIAGTVISLPLLLTGRLQRTSTIPFGPLLIAGAVLTVLFGADLLGWYQQTVLQMG